MDDTIETDECSIVVRRSYNATFVAGTRKEVMRWVAWAHGGRQGPEPEVSHKSESSERDETGLLPDQPHDGGEESEQ